MTVIVEPDLEMSEDGDVWDVVFVCSGRIPLVIGGVTYLHETGCACKADGTLCDVGWLQEFVACAGIEALTKPFRLPNMPHGGRIKITGRMVSERFDSLEGTDYDERFEVELTEPFFACGCVCSARS